jgi:probable rRNA maturation factor
VSANPRIDLNIACEGWPPADELTQLACKAVCATVKAAQLNYPANAELSLMFGDDQAMSVLNDQFRGVNKATNVLSFPGTEMVPGQAASTMLGDIIFALQTVTNEAAVENKRFDHHLSHLLIHGFLHLFGYDHRDEDEAKTMEFLEINALADLGIANPYGD